jgi:type II secretory pathway component GspD/PulD (secretin)
MSIGGILQQEESETIHRVPILGRIPVLGLLFSKKDKTITTTELIAFITPTVLRTRAEDDEVTRQEHEQMEEVNGHESRGGKDKSGPGK